MLIKDNINSKDVRFDHKILGVEKHLLQGIGPRTENSINEGESLKEVWDVIRNLQTSKEIKEVWDVIRNLQTSKEINFIDVRIQL